DSTLVIWGGEFGRSPVSDGGPGGAEGRDHNPYGFTIWMAGGGIKGGQVIGNTDELGLRAVTDRVHLNDFHASVLALLGLDHTKLTYPYLGRNFRLTDVGGKTDLVEKLRKGKIINRAAAPVFLIASAAFAADPTDLVREASSGWTQAAVKQDATG